MDTRLVTVLLLLVLAAPALSGCMGKKSDKDDGSDLDPLFERLRRDPTTTHTNVPSDLGGGAPERCEGCIRLDSAPGQRPETKPAPLPHRPTASLAVPLPRHGDIVSLFGTMASGVALNDAHPWIPADFDLDFGMDLDVARGTTSTPKVGAAPVAGQTHFGISPFGAHSGPGGEWTTVEHQHILVDLASRRAFEVQTHAYGSQAGQANLGPDDDFAVRFDERPTLGDIPWLGQHLWGRSVRMGDTFVVAHDALPGAEHPMLTYTYRILHATENGYNGHSSQHAVANGAAPDLIVSMMARDDANGLASWTLTFETDSPYPRSMEMTSYYAPAGTGARLPPPVESLSTTLRQRGEQAIAWSPQPSPMVEDVTTWAQDSTFHLDDRPASPALDTEPVYGLQTAISDLNLLLPDFAAWLEEHDQRVLVDARLTPEYPVAIDDPATLVWRLTYADGHGNLAGWQVARPLVTPDDMWAPTGSVPVAPVLGPVPVRAQADEGAPAWDAAHLTRSKVAGISLATGEQAAHELERRGIRPYVDEASYRLSTFADGSIGGTLMLGRAPPLPSYPLAGPDVYAGKAWEDLGRATLLAAITTGPH